MKRCLYLIHRCIERQQEAEKTILHLLVRKSQSVGTKTRGIALDGQITALIDHGNRVGGRHVYAVEDVLRDIFVRKALQVIIVQPEQLDQVGRSSRREPIAPEGLLGERVQQAERIVDAIRLLGEVVAVVECAQTLARLGHGHAVTLGQPLRICRENGVQFLVGNAADVVVLPVHRDVVQTVQAAEHAQLAELRHTREHGETYVPVTGLQGAVKGLQCAAVLVLQSLVADGLQHGFVVFVHEDDHTMSRLLACTTDDASKTQRERYFRRLRTVKFLPLCQRVVEKIVE